ncbi:HBR095Wp [Eremothecium sinecaudum]|uniref:Proline dehydrogenase n=1 Tax=Eremothecium sinecaudum TaxID=45286 RepID=A0A125RDZ5_9SACH|nr:HBR095Wp [Eremothecium sinecaudum]AMD18996.1 HBR095Wp [Eremothecium sinecaudum]
MFRSIVINKSTTGYLRRSVWFTMNRCYVSQTQSTQSTITAVTPGKLTSGVEAAPSQDSHLRTLSRKELFSLGMIGLTTMTKGSLNTAIKLFPYVPDFVVTCLVSSLYCGGDNMAAVRQTGRHLRERGIRNMMLSLTIEDTEGTKNINIGDIVRQTIASLNEVLVPNMVEQLDSGVHVDSIPPGYLALKPSALVANPVEVLRHFNDPNWRKEREQLVENCTAITQAVYDLNQSFSKKYPGRKAPFFVVTIDAEKYDLQKAGVYDLQRILFSRFNPASSHMVSCIGTWQMYLCDAASDLASEYIRAQRGGYRLGVKLVRGAYLHSEPDRSVIFPTKEDTDKNYNEVAVEVIRDLLAKGQDSSYGHLVIASHNYESQKLATMMLLSHEGEVGKANVVLGQLLGMADNVTFDLVHNHGARNIIKYVPWGPPAETRDYLLRRLQENGDAVRADNGWPLVKAVAKSFFKSRL